MTLSRRGVVRILGRDLLHRAPGCWYLKDSRMLHDLDDRTVEAMARKSSMATYAEGEFLHEAGEPMSAGDVHQPGPGQGLPCLTGR